MSVLNTSGSTLCIVASPFQCLCLFEALSFFQITDYDVLVGYSDELSLSKIDALLRVKGIDYSKARIAHVIKDILPLWKRIKKSYSNFIIADFNNRNGYSLACLLGEKHSTICFIDDGAQAYGFFATPPTRKHYKQSVEFVFSLYNYIGRLKSFERPVYYTIYGVQSDEFDIFRNNLSLMKSNASTERKDVFIIGTNSSMLSFKNHSYFDYLENLFKWIRYNCSGNNMFYCPHRRDLNNEDVIAFCKRNRVQVFDTEISVEYDFINQSINPMAIIGFNSNALYTLHQIYPASNCYTIKFELKDDIQDKNNNMLTNKMQEQGIMVLDVFNWKYSR